jgi:hypothetical protein
MRHSSVWVLVAAFSLTASSEEAAVDYQTRFADGFPDSGRTLNWDLYKALVENDLPAWAAAIDPSVGKRFDAARGKTYQSQRLRAALQRDARLRTAFDQQRKRIATTFVYADVDGGPREPCRRAMIYLGSEFRLVLGESAERGDPLAQATIAPGCPQTHEAGLQITAGRSPRYRCWSGATEMSCGWRLPDMPESLKRVVESEYPESIKLRWRWRGLDGNVRVRYLDLNGNRVSVRDAVAVAVPADLELQFIDRKGQLLWTARGAALGPGAH